MGLTEMFALIAVVGGAVAITAILTDAIFGRSAKQKPADPEAILAERFARGEIDEAEYSRRLSTLTFGPPLEIR